MKKRHISAAINAALAIVAALLMGGCGFHLRGPTPLPFESMYIQTLVGTTFSSQLMRSVRASSDVRITDDAKSAQVILQILPEVRERLIKSLSGSGRVRELTLRYRVSYRLYDSNNKEYIPMSEIVLQRDLSYSDTDVIAKEQEEALLYRDMENDAVQQLLRRLQAADIAAS